MPEIASLGPEKSKWVWYYLLAGLGSWAFIQYAYVGPGKNYWQGLGPAGDPMSTGSQLLISVQTVALWPIALFSTINSTGMAPHP